MKFIMTTKDHSRLTFSIIQESLTVMAILKCGHDWDFVTLCESKNKVPFIKVWRYFPNLKGNVSPPIFINQHDKLSGFFGSSNGCQCIHIESCDNIEAYDIKDFSEFIFSNNEMPNS